MKYIVNYKGKLYTQNAENAEEAMQKFANRKVFGRKLIHTWATKQIDADTRGETWGQFKTNDGAGNRETVRIEKAK